MTSNLLNELLYELELELLEPVEHWNIYYIAQVKNAVKGSMALLLGN